jgi:predicted TIM-barrel fold metal-dependent hydrolase
MRKKQKVINVFDDKSIFAIKHVISITDEEDLNQLWEYIITAHAHEESKTYPFFVSLYELSERFLATYPEVFFEIIVEQSNEYYYFTVWNKEFIKFVREHWEKRGVELSFDEKRITVRLHKPIANEKNLDEEIRIAQLLSRIQKSESTVNIPPCTFMEKNDLHELIELAEDLNVHLCEALTSSLNNDVLIRLRSYFSMISVTLNHYEEVEEMALIMSEFSMMINQNKEDFVCLNSDQIAIIEGFAHNFERWVKILFIHGGAEINFMNRSMRADMETIKAITQPPVETSEEEVNAIFDF